MINAPGSVQDLRRSLYVKAKAEPTWRFWGRYVHICKMETLREAYQMAKSNDGAPGIDGVTFEAVEESGEESFLTQIRDELVSNTYRPMQLRKKEIPKDGGQVRVLSIPAIRDRVVQGALKLILEPIFEADFQPGSFGYRPKRTAQEAVHRVAQAIVEEKTRVLDLDLRAYFDNVRHYLLLEKVARRVQDAAVMRVLKMILKATGKKGVPDQELSLGDHFKTGHRGSLQNRPTRSIAQDQNLLYPAGSLFGKSGVFEGMLFDGPGIGDYPFFRGQLVFVTVAGVHSDGVLVEPPIPSASITRMSPSPSS